MRARRNSRADCVSRFGLFADVVYGPPTPRDFPGLPMQGGQFLCSRSDVDQVGLPRWHLDFRTCPKVSANWPWGSTLLFFTLVTHTDGPGMPFSSRLHYPCPVSGAGPSGSSRSLAESLYCSDRSLKAYFRRFSRTTLSFRVTDKRIVLSPSSILRMNQINRCSVDLVSFSGTPF